MFDGCSSLTSIDLSNFLLTNSKISINYMFFGCSKLTYIDISSFSNPSYSYSTLFDNNIPSEGTIIVKNETIENNIKRSIPNWKFIYKN